MITGCTKKVPSPQNWLIFAIISVCLLCATHGSPPRPTTGCISVNGPCENPVLFACAFRLMLGSGLGLVRWILKRCKWRGFCDKELPSITETFDDTDNFFAGLLKNTRHVLQSLLPDCIHFHFTFIHLGNDSIRSLKFTISKKSQFEWTSTCCIRTIIPLCYFQYSLFYSLFNLFVYCNLLFSCTWQFLINEYDDHDDSVDKFSYRLCS